MVHYEKFRMIYHKVKDYCHRFADLKMKKYSIITDSLIPLF